MERDIAEGAGVISYKSGGLYVGQLKDDLPNGLGGMIYPDGVKYIGEWENDKANNKGIAEHKDGSRFIGGYKNGFRSRGFLITSDKKIFKRIGPGQT